jgi:hypothetical protein
MEIASSDQYARTQQQIMFTINLIQVSILVSLMLKNTQSGTEPIQRI